MIRFEDVANLLLDPDIFIPGSVGKFERKLDLVAGETDFLEDPPLAGLLIENHD